MTYELEEIENKIIDYLNKESGHKVICKDPDKFFAEMIGKRISIVQVERVLNRLENNNTISISILEDKNIGKNMKIIKLNS